MRSLLTITRRHTHVVASRRDLATAREQFRAGGYLQLKGLLDSSLLAVLLDILDDIDFHRRVHERVGIEVCVPPGPLSGAMEFLLNDPILLKAMAEMTDCGQIGCFEGRLYRLIPGTEHHDSWHSDVGQNRLLALSINLGRDPFDGGALQIRRAESVAVFAEIENRRPGDAILFRIDSGLKHRVAPVAGRVPRTAYAGWFRSQPDFRTLLRTKLHSETSPESMIGHF